MTPKQYQKALRKYIRSQKGITAAARQLGVSRSALLNRLSNPGAIRLEHIMALEYLLQSD